MYLLRSEVVPDERANSRDAAHARHHTLDIGLEGLVVERLDLRLEPLHGADVPQVVAVAELRQAAPAHQTAEHPLLRLDGVPPEAVDRPRTLREPRLENRIAKRHSQLK